MPMLLPTLQEMARLLGGEIVNSDKFGRNVVCPGPGHSTNDRSLSVKPEGDGFVVHSFANDDVNVCKDHVRSKLGLAPFEPKKKRKNGNGGGKPYSPTIAKFIYRTAEREPYLAVHRTAAKQFFQFHWDGETWKAGARKGERVPYRLPELIAAPKSTPVYITEGEGKADLLAKLGFIATSSAGGAGKWTTDLNEHFRDRPVNILPDNDGAGHKHGQLVARNLHPIAKSVKVIELPGLPLKGDVKQWLEHDPSGAKLVKEAERTPAWEPAAEPARTREADQALIAELAASSKLDYGRRRKGAAEELGVPVTILDQAVAEARGEVRPPEEEEWSVEPWPDEVLTADLLDELCGTYKQFVVLPKHGAETMALWALHDWALDAFDISPFLLFTSPMWRCGKSTALMLLKRTLSRPVLTSNISPAAIFRYIEHCHPSLIIDEGDGFVVGNEEEMRTILNSGHARDTAFAVRNVGEQHNAKKFSTWGPKAIAAIGKLAETLADRSITISMRRRKPSEKIAKLRRKTAAETFETLRRKAARWRADNVERLSGAQPDIPQALDDRQSDNWEALLAIADLAGGDWSTKARTAALALSADAELDAMASTKVRLLSDIREIRDIDPERDHHAITTKRLLSLLHEVEGAPWGSYGRSGKPISDRQFAKLLEDFKVFPRPVRIWGLVSRGYLWSSFADAFERYLPPQGGLRSVTPLQVSEINDLRPNLSVTAELNVTDENCGNPLKTRECNGVTDRIPP